MEEIDRLLMSKAVEKRLLPGDDTEYFVDGEAIGMGPGPVPCVLRVACDGRCGITLADGPDTGMEMDVPAETVSFLDPSQTASASKELFR